MHIFDLAMQDIEGLYKRWQTDRKSLIGVVDGIPYRAFNSKKFSLWRLFTTEQLAEICIYWKAKGVDVYKRLYLQEYFSQSKRSEIPRFKELIEGKGIISYNKPLQHNVTKKQILTIIDSYMHKSRRDQLAQMGCFEDPEIRKAIEEKLGRPVRSLNKHEIPIKEAIVKSKQTKYWYLTSAGTQIQRAMVRYYGDFDRGRRLREIFCQALRGKMHHRDCSIDSDAVFLDLLRVLEIKNYDECKELLPCLAEYLSEKRAGGYKRQIFFSESNTTDHAAI